MFFSAPWYVKNSISSTPMPPFSVDYKIPAFEIPNAVMAPLIRLLPAAYQWAVQLSFYQPSPVDKSLDFSVSRPSITFGCSL